MTRPTSPVPGGSSDPAYRAPTCVPERVVAEERCEAAVRSRDAHRAAQAAFREAKRRYEEASDRLREAAVETDDDTIRRGKDAAWARYQEDRAASSGSAELEAATRAWLAEIDRINRTATEAAATVASAWAAAAELVGTVERLGREVQVTRMAAERDEAECRDARAVLAECEEAARRGAQVPAPPATPVATSATPAAAAPVHRQSVPDVASGVVRAPRPSRTDLPHAANASRLHVERVVERLLQGDRAALAAAAALVAVEVPVPARQVQLLLADLADALVGAAVDGGWVRVDRSHPVWARLDEEEARAVIVALRRLGFASDGRGGYVASRPLTPHDLAGALALAGLDPVRPRPRPDAAAVASLFGAVTADVHAALADAAPDLALAELTTSLAGRAEPLALLWLHWGRIRPVLLLPVDALDPVDPDPADPDPAALERARADRGAARR